MSAKQPTRTRVRLGVYRRTNGDGSTTYEVAFRDSDGRQRRETVGPRLKEAEARYAQVKADMSRGTHVARRADMTVASAAATWLDSLGHLRPTTFQSYEGPLRCHVLPEFGHRRLEAVTPDQIARWTTRAMTEAYAVQHGHSAPYRAATIRLALRALNRVYAHAIRRQGYAGANPVSALERAERPHDDPKPRTILTPEQVAVVVAAAPARCRDLLAVMASTGCRTGEALGLTWGDLDLAARTVSFRRQADRRGRRVPLKTANARRTVDLAGHLVTALATRKLAAGDSRATALVFPSRNGTPLDFRLPGRALAQACRTATVPTISPHGLRHAHASALLADGEDLAYVSRRLGHSNVATTAQNYAHLIEDEARRQVRRERQDRLYGPPVLAVVGADR